MIPQLATARRSHSTSATGLLLGALALVACGQRTELLGLVPATGGDAAADAQSVVRPHFDAPVLVDGLNVTGADDEAPTLTGDLLQIYFMSWRTGTRHLWTSTRASRNDPWLAPQQVNELASATSYEITPSVSLDGLRLWFCSGSTPTSVWLSTRASTTDPWGAPSVVSDLITPSGTAQLNSPALSESETLFAVALRGTTTAGWDLYASTRSTVDATWSPLTALPGVNGASNEYDPALVNDGREVFFSSSRSGMDDLFWSQRLTDAGSFQTAFSLDELNTPDFKDFDPFMALDRSVLFFASNRGGDADIYQASVQNNP
jgi:Tol biopolymer transport system component